MTTEATTTDPTIAGLPYPRLAARTQNFRLGAPRSFTISPDGSRVVFVRSNGPADRVNRLFLLEKNNGSYGERELIDPQSLLMGQQENLSAEERARRERMREATSGITAYSTDSKVEKVAFALSGNLYVLDLITNNTTKLEIEGSAIDPRISPDGKHIAYPANGGFHVVTIATNTVTTLATPETDTVTYGLANFIAAEELNRFRGHWWSPDSDAVLVERVDNAPVAIWHIGDPTHPENPGYEHRYPAAGTANPEVGLTLLRLDGTTTKVTWDNKSFEYLVTASWQKDRQPLITVMSRDQKTQQTKAIDTATGATQLLHTRTDGSWVEWISGLPQWHTGADTSNTRASSTDTSNALTGNAQTNNAALLLHHDNLDTDTRSITRTRGDHEETLTPQGLQIANLIDATANYLLVEASTDPTTQGIFTINLNNIDLNNTDVKNVDLNNTSATELTQPGTWNTAIVSGNHIVIGTMTTETTQTQWALYELNAENNALTKTHEFSNLQASPKHAEPSVDPRPRFLELGERKLKAALLLPKNHTKGTKLPVLMNPYGGPHHLEVLAGARLFSEDQFIADQGFAVLVVDGAGTPMRGPTWEREIKNNVADPILQDQVDALTAAADIEPDLDLTRVGIKGWSFGGYLSALAVMDRPDVFHVGIAGAPVTDWRLYDTGYTERYLGPDASAKSYETTDLIPRAHKLSRPLMIIHGLADDNVVAAHSLQLSGALLAHGKPHTFLPLSGVTHMASQEEVAENLLKLQIDFLQQHLG